MKRLKTFFNEIPNYQPDATTVGAIDFLDVDLEQQYKIIEYKKQYKDEVQQNLQQKAIDQENKELGFLDQKVIVKLIDQSMQVPDEKSM